MLGKKLGSMKKLAKKVKVIGNADRQLSQIYESLLRDNKGEASPTAAVVATTTATGTFAVYVGEDRQRFVVPTCYLSHPLFKILLEKAYNEFEFQQSNGLVVPCSVTVFQEVMSAVECCNGRFDFRDWVEEFV